MATISDAAAVYGLSATGTPTSTNVSGSVQIGVSQTRVRLDSADVAYSLRAIFAGSGDVLALDLTTGATTGSTAWVAGQPQIETATAAGTITGAGNATVIVTAAGMTGSPKTISVAVTNADTAAQWAEKVRTALAADSAVSALFTVGGSTTAISLTRKPTSAFTVGSETVNIYAANDATLNISLDNGTCTGITTAATSANTQSGTATDGVKIYDGDGKDFEGVTIPTIGVVRGLLLEGSEEDMDVTIEGTANDYFTLASKAVILFALPVSASDGIMDSPYNFTSNGPGGIAITVIGGA